MPLHARQVDDLRVLRRAAGGLRSVLSATSTTKICEALDAAPALPPQPSVLTPDAVPAASAGSPVLLSSGRLPLPESLLAASGPGVSEAPNADHDGAYKLSGLNEPTPAPGGALPSSSVCEAAARYKGETGMLRLYSTSIEWIGVNATFEWPMDSVLYFQPSFRGPRSGKQHAKLKMVTEDEGETRAEHLFDLKVSPDGMDRAIDNLERLSSSLPGAQHYHPCPVAMLQPVATPSSASHSTVVRSALSAGGIEEGDPDDPSAQPSVQPCAQSSAQPCVETTAETHTPAVPPAQAASPEVPLSLSEGADRGRQTAPAPLARQGLGARLFGRCFLSGGSSKRGKVDKARLEVVKCHCPACCKQLTVKVASSSTSPPETVCKHCHHLFVLLEEPHTGGGARGRKRS